MLWHLPARCRLAFELVRDLPSVCAAREPNLTRRLVTENAAGGERVRVLELFKGRMVIDRDFLLGVNVGRMCLGSA